MAKKNQKFQSYTEEDREKCIKLIDSGKMSYREVSEKYNIPKGTIAGWVKRYREEGTLKTKKRGRPKKQQDKDAQIERLTLENEILKKFQAFLEHR